MTLATVQDCKDYVRVTTTAEDSLFTSLLARAKAAIERELGYPLTAASLSHIDYSEKDNFGQDPILSLPGPFKTTSPVPVVTDINGSTVDSANYTLDQRGIKIRAKAGVTFPNRPYTIVADIGLSAHPDYSARLEAIANGAIIDFVAFLYQNRTPGVASSTDEGGAAVAYEGNGTPPRIPAGVMEWIDQLPGRSGGMVLA